MSAVIEVEGWCVSYKDTAVLKDIRLAVPEGKITALIGPSGCGKTTLLKSINRLLEEELVARSEGEIYFKGVNIADIPCQSLRRRIGIVFQTPTPFPFSIEKNMLYALNYHYSLSGSQKEKIVAEKLNLAGLHEEVKDRMNLPASKLSGGQQQRLCIARSLTLDPELILLDEPCSSLDPRSTARVEETLKRLAGDMTIIIVTHNLAQARRIADYAAFLCEGKLIEAGEADQLFTEPREEETRQYLVGHMG